MALRDFYGTALETIKMYGELFDVRMGGGGECGFTKDFDITNVLPAETNYPLLYSGLTGLQDNISD
ncbi:hypothetical protein [Candidatus Endomicrobiellum trichonymphae]|uniref:hypothetical protein n=1 Tax=Endomicrobium trichonymphae TaxID=1408204 RepID=UPI000BBA8511|nr:hypothetical protein [Candidatus Endomicrobium trichonymphae]